MPLKRHAAPARRKHGQPFFWGLNLNGLLISAFGGLVSIISSVSIFLITTTIQKANANHKDIQVIKTEQARISKEYTPPVSKP